MTSPAPSPTHRPRGLLIALVVAVLVAFGWWLSRPPVANDDVEAFLNRTMGGGRFHFTADRVGTVRQGEGQVQLTVDATAHVLRPLYQSVDTADYLEHTLGVDAAATAEARRLLTAPHPASAADVRPPDPYKFTLLQPKLPADATLAYQAVLDVHKEQGQWVMTQRTGGFIKGTPSGDTRTTFAEPTLIVGDAADEDRLKAAVADFKAYAARVEGERRSRVQAHAAAVQARRQAFLAGLAPGVILGGTGRETTDQHSTPLYLQITAAGADQAVSALLRNDSGWRRARAFAGSWSADENFEHPVLTLTSGPEQAVRNGGPFLETAQTWVFNLREDGPGVFAESTPRFQYRFEPLPAAQAAGLEAHLDAEMAQALAATTPDRLFLGTVTQRTTGAKETIEFKVTARTADAETVDAVLSSTEHSWTRALHGQVLPNARRSSGQPLRLQSPASEAAPEAAPTSLLGLKEDLDLSFGFDGPALVGGDTAYAYRLVPATPADRQRLEDQRLARRRALLNVLRAGLALDGSLHEDQGFVANSRLEVDTVDPETGAVTARVHSTKKVLVYREFAGELDPSGDSVILNAGRGNLDSSGDFNAPFLLNANPSTIRVHLVGSELTGNIVGDPHWTFAFPASFFLRQTLESADGQGPPISGGVFPTFPVGAGAYLLKNDQWVALPTNNAHPVVETIKPKSEAQLTLNIVDLIQQGLTEIDRERKKFKVTYMVFDGKEPVPEPSGPGITILVVGRSPGHPPLAELGPAEASKDGLTAKIAVGGSTPEKLHFGADRVAAYVRSPGPGLVLFTTTELIGDGLYGFISDHAYELAQK